MITDKLGIPFIVKTFDCYYYVVNPLGHIVSIADMVRSSSKSHNKSTGFPRYRVPAKHLSLMNSHQIRAIAVKVKLWDTRSLKRQSILLQENSPNIKIPLLVTAGNECWNTTLCAIRYFLQLPTEARQDVINKKLSTIQRKELMANRQYLTNNLPPHSHSQVTPSTGLSTRQASIQLKDLIKSSAARSALPHSRNQALSIIGDDQYSLSMQVTNRSACVHCGFSPTVKMLNLVKMEPSDLCVQCSQNRIQLSKGIRKDSQLSHHFKVQQQLKRPLINREYTMEVDLFQFLHNELNSLASNILPLFPKQNITARVIHVQQFLSNDNFIAQQKQIAGATWLSRNNRRHPNTIGHSDAFDATILVFPQIKDKNPNEQNFAVIMKSNFDSDDVDAFSRLETAGSIKQNQRGRRAGPAAGVTQFTDRDICMSFSKITRKNTSVLLASSENATNMSIRYYNKDDDIKQTNFGYKSLYMKRMRKSAKWAEACSFNSYRHILMNEATCYIVAIACLNSLGIPPPKEQIHRLPTLKSILKQNQYESIQSCMVMWMCTTGEMRNHQAVACHVDGNKCHPYEIYSLFHRDGMDKKDGMIYLPLNNIVLQLECNNHLMVCNFKSSPHAADESRNTHNFSRVHGPDP